MNCVNCAAPLELADGRTVLTCAYCLTRQKLTCPGDDGDRVVSLSRPAGVDCPRCELELDEAAIDGHPANLCPDCHGVLVRADVFADVTWNRRTAYRGTEMSPSPIDPDSLQLVVDCPGCHLPMDVHPHYGPGRAVIDSCHRCNLVWLDNSELKSIEQTPGLR